MHLQDGIMEVGKMKEIKTCQHWYDDEYTGFCKEEAIIQHWKQKVWLCQMHYREEIKADRADPDRYKSKICERCNEFMDEEYDKYCEGCQEDLAEAKLEMED